MIASSTTDWLTGIATAAAAVGTVGTLVAALVQLSRQRASRERHMRRGQAEKVSAWIGERDAATVKDAPDDRRQSIELLNASAEPVYRAIVYLVYIQELHPGRVERWRSSGGSNITIAASDSGGLSV